jgi:hypothetical protein
LPLTFLEEHTTSIFRVEEMRSRLCQSVYGEDVVSLHKQVARSVASQNLAWGERIGPDWGDRSCDRGEDKNWDTKVIFPVLQFLLIQSSLYYLCSSCGSEWPHSLKPM